MRFRVLGNSIVVLRSELAVAGGKARLVPIGRINRATLKLSAKLEAACSPDERREIDAWVAHFQDVEAVTREHAAATLAEQMTKAGAWFGEIPPGEGQKLADDILGAWVSLRRVLRKRGY